MEQTRRPNPWIAFFLSLVTPGVGQLYDGLPKRASLFYGVVVLLPMLYGILSLPSGFKGMVFSMSVTLGYAVFAAIDAVYSARRVKEINKKRYQSWYTCLILLLLQAFIVSPFEKALFLPYKPLKIPSSSMIPVLTVGDHLMVDEEAYSEKIPGRGDIVVFDSPKDPSMKFIRRVIGLPGEKIEICEKIVRINDHPLDEPYVTHTDARLFPASASTRDNMAPLVVPQDAVFVLGDNRDESFDSRHYQPVALSLLRGKPLYTYWSLDLQKIGKEIR